LSYVFEDFIGVLEVAASHEVDGVLLSLFSLSDTFV